MFYKSLILATVASALLLGLLLGFAVFSQTQSSQGQLVLLDPEMAPQNIKPLVMKGFQILLETKKNLPEYVGARLNCTNCHFNCGNTFGGINEGFSLVGVSKRYPREVPGNPHFTLADRINACFTKSMNGKPVPVDSPAMKAMIAYLDWISDGLTTPPSWLGTKKLHFQNPPNVQNGELHYKKNCAICHGNDGDGQIKPDQLSYPPVWGKNSFNTEAGMHEVETLASFIYYNMPYQDPGLTIEEALDIATFISQQPRPTP